MEFIIVLAIVAILAIMAVPALMTIVPSAQLRASARGVAGLMQQGRTLAENSHKPARVVLADCRGASAPHPCTSRGLEMGVFNAYLEAAVFNADGTFDEWVPAGVESRRSLSRGVVAAVAPTDPPHTMVAGNPNGVLWAVFMPSGELWASHSDPQDMATRLLFSHARAHGADWRLTVSRGRAALDRME